MNKPEIIDGCTYRLGRLSRKEVEVAFEVILELMANALTEGRGIEIRGLGSFSLKTMKARMTRNPKTGAPVKLEQKVKVHFKPGKLMKDNVNASMELNNE
jgi:integration host factor subunit beta